MQKSPVVKRSIVIADHMTSVSLEDEFWKGLKEIAALRRTKLTGLVSKIASQREHGNLSSACRIFVLNFYRNQVPNTEGGEGLHEVITRSAQMHSWRD
jgi:predicted DNA-binding ribbon-helix-helix protein